MHWGKRDWGEVLFLSHGGSGSSLLSRDLVKLPAKILTCVFPLYPHCHPVR